MLLIEKDAIIKFCKKNHVSPNKSRGQNFLIRPERYEKIIDAAELKPHDAVLEVGTGLGGLTHLLASRCQSVFTVDIDPILARSYGIIFEGQKKITLCHADVMKKDFDDRFLEWLSENRFQNYKIVANLPYGISSHFLRKFLEYPSAFSLRIPLPETMTLLLQREVAERIVADPGSMSLLSVSVQYFSDASIIDTLPPSDFWPSPEVHSSLITIRRKSRTIDEERVKKLFRLVRVGFSARRKQLHNTLAPAYPMMKTEYRRIFGAIGLQENVRAQELALSDWENLLDQIGGR